MRPLAMEPGVHLFRRMLALSGVFHALTFLLGVLWLSFSAPPLLVAPVTVVDLIGGGQLAGSERSEPPSTPAVSRSQNNAGNKGRAVRETKREKRERVKREMREKRAARLEAARPREVSPSDSRAFSEIIRRMREEKASKTQVRDAVDTIRRETDVRAAVKRIGERVGHRVDLSAVRSAGKGTGQRAPAGLPGASGTTQVAPEILAYARALDEKVRANWTVPELAEKVAKTLMVQVRITIEKDGAVSNVRMEKVSGNSYFDDSVERAIRKASPLPVPPEQLRGGEDHYEVGFRFYGGGEQ